MRELKQVRQSNQELQSSNRDLQQALGKALKSIDCLVAERTSQLGQQALTLTAITSRLDKLEERMEGLSLRSDKMEEAFRSWTPHGRSYTGTSGGGTPVIRERTNREKRWSMDSLTSLTSATHEGAHNNHQKPFVWQMPFTVKCIGTFKGHKGTIWSLLAHSNWLFSSSSDGTIKVWDTADLRKGCVRTVTAHKDCAISLAVCRGVLYSSGTDLALRSWHIDTMEEVGAVLKAHDSMISAMICSKQSLFTSSLGCIKVWDLISLKEIHRINNISQSWIRALAYDKRSDYLYSTTNNRLHVWRASDDFGLVKEVETHFGAIYSLGVTHKFLVTGTHSRNIQVYDRGSLSHHCTLNGHIGIVTVLRVTESPVGVFMFSGSSDNTVQVWNLENMLPILALQRHEKPVQALAICQDSVFTGSEDMEIKVFRHFKL
jgi:E3 ubiquitin-protein ligase TRAF7